MELIGGRSRLLEIPDDLLSHICLFLEAYPLQVLSFTCPRMHRRLKHGAIVQSLCFNTSKRIYSFPKFLATFSSLRELVLRLYMLPDRILRFDQSILSCLPKTLRKLHFYFLGAHGVWFRHFRIFPGRKFRTSLSNQLVSSCVPLDLNEYIPNVTDLSLGGESRELGLSLVSHLPPSVTSFFVFGCTPASLQMLIPPLPPQLRSLKVQYGAKMEENSFSNVSQLSTLWLPNLVGPCPILKNMPVSITHLSFGTMHACKLWKEEETAWIAQLRDLVVLQIHNARCLPHLSLLTSLQKLECSETVNAEQIRGLPKNLTFLSLERLDLPIQASFDFWPPNLKYLKFSMHIEYALGPEDKRWHALPKSLTFLEPHVENRYRSIPIAPSFLPPALQKIHWKHTTQEALHRADYRHLHELRDFLVYMEIPEGREPYQIYIPHKLQSFRWLSYRPKPFSLASDFLLPSTLTVLELPQCQSVDDDFILRLPSGLLELNLQPSFALKVTEKGLRGLPRRLEFLEIALLPTCNADAFISSLPATLTDLRLRGLARLDDSHVQLLPRSLTFLELRNVSTGLTDAMLPFLPRNLKNIGLRRNKTITPEAFFATPLHYLSFFDLRKNPLFTRKKVLQLAPPLLGFKTRKITRESYPTEPILGPSQM